MAFHGDRLNVDLGTHLGDSRGRSGRAADLGFARRFPYEKGSVRGQLFTGGPRPGAGHHDARVVGHHDRLELAFLSNVGELIVKCDERVVTPLSSAVFDQGHAHNISRVRRLGQVSRRGDFGYVKRLRAAAFAANFGPSAMSMLDDTTPPISVPTRTPARQGFERRRAAMFDAMAASSPSAVAILPAAPTSIRNNDVEHEYRQDSDFFYLTGFDEPQSMLVMDARERKSTLFVRPRDRDREVWDGPRAGVDGARQTYGADQAFVIAELDDKLPELLENRRRIYYRLGIDRKLDDRLLSAIDRVRARQRTGVVAPVEIVDSGVILHEMRLRKSAPETESMRHAARITREAHELAMHRARAGMREFEVEALLLDTFRRRGSERPAYGSIVGSGPNACVLHYRKNDRRIESGDLLLIDAGCEYDYYASDVTRTFPVGASFSREQQAIYELVLEAQLEGIAAVRPGATLDAIHGVCVGVIARGLVRLGLLSGEVENVIKAGDYKRFFMHRTSHWLGMDVHDVGGYFVDGKPRPLECGFVLTVEPGIYIAPDDATVAPSWRGIGVRIEDDVLVTDSGAEVLTEGIPKTVEDVVRACAP